MREIGYDALVVEGTLLLEELKNEPHPACIFSPADFPGLFQAREIEGYSVRALGCSKACPQCLQTTASFLTVSAHCGHFLPAWPTIKRMNRPGFPGGGLV
jgi:hypothetical protein